MRTLIALFVLLPLAAAAQGDGFTVLFNGKDLTGWKTAAGQWAVEDGVLVLKTPGDGKMRNQNYLWTEKTYGDFVLDIEFKVPPERANSGVFIRTASTADPVQTGIEIQVGHVNPDRPLGRGSVGGIYDLVAPKENRYKAGEWNKYRITCRGSKITVELNGAVASEADLDLWTQANLNPDGSKNKFKMPLKDFARSGYIGLQDHGSAVSYRNIRIKVLASEPRP